MTDDAKRTGGCHCGAVRFEVKLADGLDTARRCDCTFCRMRGAVTATALADDLELTSGADLLTRYQFNTRVAEHCFCSRCGIYTHHRRRSNPSELGVNVACLDGVSPFDFPVVTVNNGRVHPRDAGPGYNPVAGILRYEPNG
jgi:hypothetical protein